MTAGKCPICNKTFAYEPEFWAYKLYLPYEHKKYFCSYKCQEQAKTIYKQTKRAKHGN